MIEARRVSTEQEKNLLCVLHHMFPENEFEYIGDGIVAVYNSGEYKHFKSIHYLELIMWHIAPILNKERYELSSAYVGLGNEHPIDYTYRLWNSWKD